MKQMRYTAQREATWLASRWWYAAVLPIALALRVVDLGQFVTVDEAVFWMHRSERWLAALWDGSLSTTVLSAHPGVTTMWLGALGQQLTAWLDYAGVLANPSYAQRLALAQLPVALIHTFGVLLGYALLRRLFTPGTALLAALLWATDPFTVGFSRVLHVDGLAGTALTVSVLAACLAWRGEVRLRWVALAGVAAAAAALSKWTGLVALPVVGAAALLAAWEARGTPRARAALTGLVVFTLVAAGTALLLYPALWGAPERVLEQFRTGVELEGGQPHATGNFYLGQEDLAPGWSFYPTALVLRSTPWMLLGLLALPWALRQQSASRRRAVLLAAGCVLMIVLGLSPFPKKFNRYLVTAFPLCNVLAAVGLAGVGSVASRRFGAWLPERAAHPGRAPRVAGAGVAALAISTAVTVHPYALTYFNPLFGGGARGAQTFQVGWGEGMEQAAAWLNAQPDITGVGIATTRKGPLQPYLRPGANAYEPYGAATLPPDAGYAVIYVRDAQVQVLDPFPAVQRAARLRHTVTVGGVPYAWIYQIPPPVAQQRQATFAGVLRLRGYDIVEPPAAQSGTTLHLFWDVLAKPAQDYRLFAHAVNQEGQRLAQVDPVLPSRSWEAGSFVTTEVALPAVPSGTGWSLIVGVYEPETQQRLPLTDAPPFAPERVGPDALCLFARGPDGAPIAC